MIPEAVHFIAIAVDERAARYDCQDNGPLRDTLCRRRHCHLVQVW